MDIQERISLLPQFIQILILEFNVDHRPLLQKVHQEYLEIIYPLCRVCSAPFDKMFCSMDYFIIQKHKLNCHWCGIDCFERDTDRELKLKCLQAVQDYVGSE